MESTVDFQTVQTVQTDDNKEPFVEYNIWRNNNTEFVGKGKLSLQDADLLKHKFYLNHRGYPRLSLNSQTVTLHLHIMNKTPEGHTVHHKNSDVLDTRRSNLMYATRSLQSHAQKRSIIRKNGALYYGTLRNTKDRWYTQFKGTTHALCDTEEQAAAVYNLLAKKEYGNEAVLNKIELVYTEIPEEFKMGEKRRSKNTGGIYYDKKIKRYQPRVKYNGTDYNLGAYESEELAEKAIDIKLRCIQEQEDLLPIPRTTEGVAYFESNDKRVLVDDDIYRRFRHRTVTFIENYAYIGSSRLHRIVMNAKTDDPMVDHLHGNLFDNRKHMLRFATGSQNGQNRTKRLGCKSQYIGVSTSHGRWVACIQKTDPIGGKRAYREYFSDQIKAAEWYDQKAIELYGVHAKVNFPSIDRLTDTLLNINLRTDDEIKAETESVRLAQKEVEKVYDLELALFKFTCLPIQQRGTVRKLASGWQARGNVDSIRKDVKGFATSEEAYAETTMHFYEQSLKNIHSKYGGIIDLASLAPVREFIDEEILKLNESETIESSEEKRRVKISEESEQSERESV